MSSLFSKNKKELAGVAVVSASDVWATNSNGNYVFHNDVDVVGKVEISMPNMVLKANARDKKTAFVEDVSALPKRAKCELVNHFFDSSGNATHKRVAYLVRTDRKSKTAPEVRAALKNKKKR